MTTIVKAADAAHFLSLVPAVLGFTPTRSLVLVPFHRGRSIGAMRLDLPHSGADLDAFAATCLGMVCRLPDADALAAAVFTDQSCGEGLPGAALARSLRRAAEACGVHLTDALTVGCDGWGSHFDTQLPPGGRPLTALSLPPPATVQIASGDQASGAVLPPLDPGRAEAAAAALRSLRSALTTLCGDRDEAPDESPEDNDGTRIDPAALVAACRLDDVVEFFEQTLEVDAAALAPYDAALLLWCLSRPALRDVALVQWSADAERGIQALEAQRRWEEGAEYPPDLAMTMWGEGPRPDPDRLGRALAVARHAAALAPTPLRPGALATCAWLSWALGRSTHAERYARLAVQIEPEHGLSEIVLSFVAAGHLPDWAFRRS
ncbi:MULTISPECIES: DUF4192 domain-containing protein [unclassified Microbacterium]|uniref:DUF4192 domain-containing protein n=1 Tax=unclassified Microbacterium TaxID=2609290 RepID=UPI00214D0EC4|nr:MULTISPECIES: DUF4192 domain-containing protein [unclassified Microbacterium]MCR2784736.1 DUF4192 domain-containing protein [Microbacterium sp. zg.B96]WIM16275.1 DUF4192 domain-containing protein [Microbacterium sp. zg-B96]